MKPTQNILSGMAKIRGRVRKIGSSHWCYKGGGYNCYFISRASLRHLIYLEMKN